MINDTQYKIYLSRIKNDHSKLEIITNLEEIQNFENNTGKEIGMISHLPYYDVFFDVVKEKNNPNGREFCYAHLDYPGKGGAAALVSVTSETDGKTYFVLLTIERFPMDNRTLIEIPRGFKDYSDKNTRETIVRELFEETGLSVDKMQTVVRFLGSVSPDSGICNNEVDIYSIEITTPEKITNIICHPEDESEVSIKDYMFCTEEELYKLILENRIIDSFTHSAVLRYLLSKQVWSKQVSIKSKSNP